MKPIICLDGDGVLLDFHAAYRQAWHQAFGELPALKDRHAYWPMDRRDVRRLEHDELAHFRSYFDDAFWRTVPAIPGAKDACQKLVDAGYDLVCVTALEDKFRDARLQNLRDHGFPLHQVVTTGNTDGATSPKAEALRALQPIAFVDDYLPYLRNIPCTIHAALILREPNGSPNLDTADITVHSRHSDLAVFSTSWLQGRGGL